MRPNGAFPLPILHFRSFNLDSVKFSILRHSFFHYLFSMSGKAHSVEGEKPPGSTPCGSSRMSLPHDCCPMLNFDYISLRNPRAYSINRESKGDSLLFLLFLPRNTNKILFFHWWILSIPFLTGFVDWLLFGYFIYLKIRHCSFFSSLNSRPGFVW